jgi:hypothetical protein
MLARRSIVALTYEIEDTVGLITLTLSGEVTGEDITGYVSASRGDPLFRPGLHRLIVADGVTGFPELPRVRELTRRTELGPAKPAHRIAAVATTPLSRGMIAMFLGHWGLADSYELFDAVPPARDWILSNLPPTSSSSR